MQTKIKTWMAQPWRSAVLAAAVALFLLQAPSAAWAKGKQVDKANKAEHSAGKAKSKVKSKAKSTAENHGHKKNSSKLSAKAGKTPNKKSAEKVSLKHARAEKQKKPANRLSETAQVELASTRAGIASAHTEQQANIREVRRAQLALAGMSQVGDEDDAGAAAPIGGAAATSWGKRSGLQYAADPVGLSASVGYLMDAKTQEVLYSKNENAVLPIASITKLMTAVVISEANLPMDEAICISEDDVDHLKNSSSRLKVGTTLSRGQMLLLALMSSENRAAHSLARTFPGGTYNFVRYMNQKAQDLGMKNTRYADPTGLSSENQSSAHDLALLVAHAAKDATLRTYSTSPEYAVDSVDGRLLQYHNSNALVRGGAWPIDLQKTGYIREAGRCMVLQTQLGGRSVVMVLLDAADSAQRRGDAERLRLWIEGGSTGLYAAGSAPGGAAAVGTAAVVPTGAAGGFVQTASNGGAAAGGGNIMRALRGGM